MVEILNCLNDLRHVICEYGNLLMLPLAGSWYSS